MAFSGYEVMTGGLLQLVCASEDNTQKACMLLSAGFPMRGR